MDYVIDDTKLAERLYRFVAYVQYRNNKDFGIDDKTISFEDTNGYLGDAEDYKTEIAAKARKALQSAKWTRENSDGVIAQGVLAAIRADLNLVDSHQKSLI